MTDKKTNTDRKEIFNGEIVVRSGKRTRSHFQPFLSLARYINVPLNWRWMRDRCKWLDKSVRKLMEWEVVWQNVFTAERKIWTRRNSLRLNRHEKRRLSSIKRKEPVLAHFKATTKQSSPCFTIKGSPLKRHTPQWVSSRNKIDWVAESKQLANLSLIEELEN